MHSHRQGCLIRECFGPGMRVRALVRFNSAKLLVQKWASLNGLASAGLFGDKASLKLVVISLRAFCGILQCGHNDTKTRPEHAVGDCV